MAEPASETETITKESSKMYSNPTGGHVLGAQLPNTGDSWVMMAAGIVTVVAGVVIIASTVAYIVAKRTNKAKAVKA